jgi:nucleoside-diphosphate-sugar epimerase
VTEAPVKRLVVTGLSGNVGTAFLRLVARSRPEWVVTGIVRRRPDVSAPPYDAAAWVELDLGAPEAPATLTRTFSGADAVVHLAWALQPSHRPERMTRTNVVGSRHVIDAARAAGVPHLVHASSLGAYSPMIGGTRKPPMREEWPTGGIRSSLYSRQKVAVERMLDALETETDTPVVTRVRPGLVLQAAAASALARYFLGALAPAARVAPRLPVVPLPPNFYGSAVHADDLAEALQRIVEQVPAGAFNIAADPPLDSAAVARALGARMLPVPFVLARGVTDLTWRLRVQPTDVGWLDIARASPVLDSTRARTELGWSPRRDPEAALREVVAGLRDAAGAASPVLEPLR